jgi:hypothetical protein
VASRIDYRGLTFELVRVSSLCSAPCPTMPRATLAVASALDPHPPVPMPTRFASSTSIPLAPDSARSDVSLARASTRFDLAAARRRLALPLAFGLCAVLSACSGGSVASGGASDGDAGDTGDGGDGLDGGDGDSSGGYGDGDGDGDAGSEVLPQTLTISPLNPTQKIDATGRPTVKFHATLTPPRKGVTPKFTWTADHPELGMIDPSTGVFTPKGGAGKLTVTVSSGKHRTSTQLTLVVNATQEGDPDANKTTGGAGGAGGVGGEGGGTKITDPKVRAALDTKPTKDSTLKWLYPYDGTVWPRGLPAPLLQWSQDAHAAVAVRITIEVDDSFQYKGYFGRPKKLDASAPFVHVPIPQDVWQNALYSGSTMKVSLVIAASDGAGGYAAYTPTKNPTWTIAPGSLKGTVYYNSYGTKLAQQIDGLVGRFGGATLAIRGSSFDPVLIAGSTTDDNTGCRVCHTVSGNGSLLIAQHADNLVSSAYDLTNKNMETPYPAADDGKFGWAALSPDGSVALGNAGPPGNNSSNIASLATSALYKVSDGTVLDSTSLTSFVTQASTPLFSVDGKHVAFNFHGGPGSADITGDGKTLVMMDFDPKKNEFSKPTALYASTDSSEPCWPFFLPDGSGLVFELETAKSTTGTESYVTRTGSRGELWWTDLKGNAHPLDRLNGEGYLPTNASHSDDTGLQFEPTVAPIVAGGYAWVVFTSRRLYGNIATRDPYQSDPRDYDLTEADADGPTTKKLWVAAIDVPPKPGTDPSHPAFYLPAQELYAGNSRGFWVPDACHKNGDSCESGDECCGGYCRSDDTGAPVCTDMLPPETCAQEYEACDTTDDCCAVPEAPLTCIAGRCAQTTILR